MSVDLGAEKSLTDVASARRVEWKSFFMLMLPIALTFALYWASTASLVVSWNDYDNDGNTHGWMVAAICIWLIYRRAASFSSVNLQPASSAIVLLCFGSIAWLLLVRINVQIGYQILLPILAWFAVAAFYGYAIARSLLFPIGYFYYAIPIWGVLNAAFQWATIIALRVLLRIISIPAYFEGDAVHLPDGVFHVEGGCSGLHYFVVAMAIASLHIHLTRIRRKYRVLLLAAILAVLANWIRVLTIVLAGHYTHMQSYLVRVEHVRFGWAMFAVMMIAFFYLADKIKDDVVPDEPQAQAPMQQFPAYAIVLAALSLLVGPLWHYALKLRTPLAAGATVQLRGAEVIAEQESIEGWSPKFENADAQKLIRFRTPSNTIDIYRAVFIEETQGKKLAGFYNQLFDSANRVLDQGTVGALAPDFSQTVIADRNDRKWLIWSRYDVGDQYFRSALIAQSVHGLRSIVNRENAGVTLLRTECANSCESASQTLAAAVRALTIGH